MSLVVIVDTVDGTFPGCQANNVYHILNQLSTLSKTHNERSAGRGRAGSLRCVHTPTLTQAHTQIQTFLLAKWRHRSETVEGTFIGLVLVLCFAN